MAKKDKTEATQKSSPTDDIDNLSKELIADLNKSFGTRVAYNLSTDVSPTHVKRWIPVSSRLLNYVIANRRGGGLPEGRIIEIAGQPSSGKSHIAFDLAIAVQRMGGLVVYIDTENAVMVDRLGELGINTAKRFVYADTHCTEEVFQIIEKIILKAKDIIDKNVPILIVWDSVAATSPKAELEGDITDQTMGLQARVIAKGMRKITGIIGQNNVTLLCLNQVKDKVGVTFGDPSFTPGGKAIPFHASVRIRLQGNSPIKKGDEVIGIAVTAVIKKNKVARPHRQAEFDIIFGKGIDESAKLYDLMAKNCEKDGPFEFEGKSYTVGGGGAWKEFVCSDPKTGEVFFEKKFNKGNFTELFNDAQHGPILESMLEKMMVIESLAVVDEGESPTDDEDETEE